MHLGGTARADRRYTDVRARGEKIDLCGAESCKTPATTSRGRADGRTDACVARGEKYTVCHVVNPLCGGIPS